MKRVGIIGAGRFGTVMAESLVGAGIEVLLIDRNRPAVQSASALVNAVQGDATQQRVLEEAGFGECDVVIVAIGSNIEASMMATANCKELGVPEVVAKASSELHRKILMRLGADKVVDPDRDRAHQLAMSIANHNSLDLVEVEGGYSISEIDVPDNVVGLTLAEADLRKKSGVTVLCIRRVDQGHGKLRKVVIPQAGDVFESGDRLIVFGSTKKLDEFA